jgi:hypothetical protein
MVLTGSDVAEADESRGPRRAIHAQEGCEN